MTRQPFEYVTPIRAVECVEGACIGNALPDGGVVDHPELGYCSRTCTANADSGRDSRTHFATDINCDGNSESDYPCSFHDIVKGGSASRTSLGAEAGRIR